MQISKTRSNGSRLFLALLFTFFPVFIFVLNGKLKSGQFSLTNPLKCTLLRQGKKRVHITRTLDMEREKLDKNWCCFITHYAHGQAPVLLPFPTSCSHKSSHKYVSWKYYMLTGGLLSYLFCILLYMSVYTYHATIRVYCNH